MRAELVDAAAGASWDAALSAMQARGVVRARDPMFSAAYHQGHAAHVGGTARLVVCDDGGRTLAFPYLRVPIDARRADAQSAHGYGGPLATTDDPDFLRDAWGAARAVMRADDVVSAFARLHPLAGNEAFLPPDASLRVDRTTASIDPRAGLEGAALSVHRNMLRRAARLGLRADVGPLDADGARAFLSLYEATMSRLDADATYRFGAAYLAALGELGDAISLARVRGDDGAVVAMALALWGAREGDYHLAARVEGSENCAGNLMLHALAQEANRRGLDALHLGGGRTPDPDDALWRFKSRVGTGRHTFQTAGWDLDADAASSLRARWAAAHGEAPRWFLGWRQPPRSRAAA
ncbi:MAG: GNAT family N-acetyltransferase [Polyangiales bacterium]